MQGPTLDKPRLGRQIKSIRQRMGWTQVQFAGALGVTVNSLYRWETGREAPGGASTLALSRLGEELDPPIRLTDAVSGPAIGVLR